ncbi:MAG: hypothetical protein ACWGOV_01430 [Acidiferrobacterales bacterium]
MANSCRCGHIFEANSDSAEYVEMASQEEEAYEAYLAARLDQARIAAERAIQVLTQNPSDKQNIVQAERANRELEQINNEYATQLAIVEKAHTRARIAKSHAEKIQSTSRNVVKKSENPTRFSAPKIVSLSSSAVSAEQAREARRKEATEAPSRAVTRARSGRLRQDASAAILARRAAQQLIAQRAEALAARRPGQTAMPEKMRESTRDKAEKAVQQSRRSSSSISGDLAAAVQALDSKVNSKPMSKSIMECPNCTTHLPVTAEKCGCGYQFKSGADSMPGLSLDAKDLQDLF